MTVKTFDFTQRGKTRQMWLHSSFLLLVTFCASTVLATDEKLDKLVLSSGGSRHRLLIHRKKSERHRHQNAYPMPEEQLSTDTIDEDVFDDVPEERRSLGNIKRKKKKDKRDEDKSNKLKNKDNGSETKQNSNKDQDSDRSRDDKDKRKKNKKDVEEERIEKDRRKKDKLKKVEDDVEKRKKKKGKDDVKEKEESGADDSLMHTKDGDNNHWEYWDISAAEQNDDWHAGGDWNHPCICEDWLPPWDDWTSPDDWESADDWSSSDSSSIDWTSSLTQKMKKKLKKRKNKNKNKNKNKRSLTSEEALQRNVGTSTSNESPSIRDLTSLSKKFALEGEDTEMAETNNVNTDEQLIKSDSWWGSEDYSESWDWWSAEDEESSSSTKSSKSKTSKSRSSKSSKSSSADDLPIKWCSCNPTHSPNSMPFTYPPTRDEPAKPSIAPSSSPTEGKKPSIPPSIGTPPPTDSSRPTILSSAQPSHSSKPTIESSDIPSRSLEPSAFRTKSDMPSDSTMPSGSPSISNSPTVSQDDSDPPSISIQPSDSPKITTQPSNNPSNAPSIVHSSAPSDEPSSEPSGVPSASSAPSDEPSSKPSGVPSVSSEPSNEPSLEFCVSPTDDDACDLTTTGEISAGSCIGISACIGTTSDVGRNSCLDIVDVPQGNEPAEGPDQGVCQNSTGASIGTESCYGLEACHENKGTIGDGSCIYDGSCFRNEGNVTDGSCSGLRACLNNEGGIGKDSCIFENVVVQGEDFSDSCNGNKGHIDEGSCLGLRACEDNEGNIGKGSCIALGLDSFDDFAARACLNNTGIIKDGSCLKSFSCFENRGDVDDGSCNGEGACELHAEAPIGEMSCNGVAACSETTGEIGSNSCTGDGSCCGNTTNILPNTCQGDFECCNSDVCICSLPSDEVALASLSSSPISLYEYITGKGSFGAPKTVNFDPKLVDVEPSPTQLPTPITPSHASNGSDLDSQSEATVEPSSNLATSIPTASQLDTFPTSEPTIEDHAFTGVEQYGCTHDFCTLEASDDCIIAYRINDGLTITVELACEDGNDEWVGVGFSSDGQMVNSEAVLGIPGQRPLKYALNGKYTAAVTQMPNEDQTLIEASLTVEDGRTVMIFTKNLNEHMREDGEDIYLLFAKGMSSTLGYHPSRSSFKLTS